MTVTHNAVGGGMADVPIPPWWPWLFAVLFVLSMWLLWQLA